MLAQILHDLHVPRELLDGLPEDQKQLLFCKMREEQIRRYHEREEEEMLTRPIVNTKKKKKHVTFRLGTDGNEWCWVMGESTINEQLNKKINNENIEIDRQNQTRNLAGVNHTLPIRTDGYYTVHRDERKQIEEMSNNIQEARRIFERLELDTQRLVLNKESEVQQQLKSYTSSSNDIIDEEFYREIEERSKKVEQEKREIARRARDNFHRNSLQLNVCFDTDNHTSILLQPPPLNLSNKTTNEKNIQIEFVNKKSSIQSNSPIKDLKTVSARQEQSPLTIVEDYPSKPLLPLTREDIRRWFCTIEKPYGTFRSPNGQIYSWFHGIISRSYTEQILSSKPIGSYLIRINEKIFGYALSYRASDHCRHLLIEVISSSSLSNRNDHQIQQQHAYRFLGGAKHESFTHLNHLIEKYSNTPIRSNSTDVLRHPCGQMDPQRPDYADLFIENNKHYESLYIPLETMTSTSQSTTHL